MAASAAAQTNATAWNTVKALPAGTEVRIAAGSHTVRGKIDRITDDTLVVTSGDGQEMFAQQEVTRVSVGKQGHRGRNALIGLWIGAGAGLGVGAAADAGCNGICFLGDLGKEVFTPVGAVAGVLLGALIPTGGWREIYKK
jgi:preprotein translocase subunit YajC